MNETAQRWLDQAAAIPGVLAGGVRHADQSVLVKSCDDRFPVEEIEKVVRELGETIPLLQNFGIAAGRLRWTFESAWLHSAVRTDGAVAVLVVTRQIESSPEVEQLLAGF